MDYPIDGQPFSNLSAEKMVDATLSGEKFRELSLRQPDAVKSDIDQYERCHKVPNELCTAAYNSAASEVVRQEILAFAFNHVNLILATDDRNDRIHNAAEKDLKASEATVRQENMKGDQIATAVYKGLQSGVLSPEAAAHLLQSTQSSTAPLRTFQVPY